MIKEIKFSVYVQFFEPDKPKHLRYPIASVLGEVGTCQVWETSEANLECCLQILHLAGSEKITRFACTNAVQPMAIRLLFLIEI